MKRTRITWLINAFCLACLLAVIATAQSSTAPLSSIVVDEQCNIVHGAAFTLLNPATQQQRQATSNADGNFTFTQLPPASTN